MGDDAVGLDLEDGMKMVRARTLSQYRSGQKTELGRVRRRGRGGRRNREEGLGPFRPRRRDQGAERSGQQPAYPVAPMQPGYPGMPMPPWAQPYGMPGYPPGYPQPVPGAAAYPQQMPAGYPAVAPAAPPAPQTAGMRFHGRDGRRFSPPAQLGANLRVQAAEGSRAAIVELEPGMFLVAEVPDEMTRSEFGIASVLAPLVINTATKALTKQLSPGSSAPAAAPGSSAPIYTCYPQGMAPQQNVLDSAVQQGVTALVSAAQGGSSGNALTNLVHKGTNMLTHRRDDDDVSGWGQPRPWWEGR